MKKRANQLLGNRVGVAALVAALAGLLVPAGASAASPVLEFVAPSHSLSEVSVTTESGPVTAEMASSELVLECAESHGEGKITGPRTVVAEYQFSKCEAHEPSKSNHECNSVGAQKEEITTGPIEADLVWIDQAKHEVGMLLNPNGSPTQPYISFECGGISAAGFGPFLSPGSPINEATETFTMTLRRSGSTQTVTEYEGEEGKKLQAIPTGEKGKNSQRVDTSVEMTVAVHTSVPVEVRAITAAEVEAAATKKHQEEAAIGAAKKKQEEEVAATAAAKKKQEEEAAAKKHAEEEIAAKRRAEEEAKKKEESKKRSELPTRDQLLTKALKRCKRDKPKGKRMRCEKAAEKKYGTKGKKKKGKHHGGLSLGDLILPAEL